MIHSAEEVAYEIQVLGLTCRAVKLNQRHLQFRMTGEEWTLGGAEIRYDVIRKADAGVQQGALSSGPIKRNARLNQVPPAIILMRANQFSEPQVRSIAHVVCV